MSVRGLTIISAVALAAFLLLRPAICSLGRPGQAARGPAPGVIYLERVEAIVFEQTNRARAKAGLPSLHPEPGLVTAARSHSADMLSRSFFDHVNPDGEGPDDRVARLHRRLVGNAGENVWTRYGSDNPSAEELAGLIMKTWMASPGHRANIERPRFTYLGVGVASAGGKITATQNFATVRAYLEDDVPMTVKRGSQLQFAARLVAGTSLPELVDIWAPDRGMKVAEPMAMTEVNVDVPAGFYQLRFYQKNGDGYTIWSGPSFKVE